MTTHRTEPAKHAAEATWVATLTKREASYKDALARYIANHYIEYANVLLVPSGTTGAAVVKWIFDQQVETHQPLDLVILTNNLSILAEGGERKLHQPDLFGNTQIISTGGALQQSINSFVGSFAELAITSDLLRPHIVILGTTGVSFEGFGRITYQFADEVSVQVAFATTPTQHRILVCDHSKLGQPQRWKGPDFLDVLQHTERSFTLLASIPDDNDSQTDRPKETRAAVVKAWHDFEAMKHRIEEKHPEMGKKLHIVVVDKRATAVGMPPKGVQEPGVSAVIRDHAALQVVDVRSGDGTRRARR
jgi:DeoR/GlpR family transcriptional regulator of sugar metabolism